MVLFMEEHIYSFHSVTLPAVLWSCGSALVSTFNADPDTDFYLNSDPGRHSMADLVRLCRHKKLDI
jgi:hypothetical protein